MAGPDRGYGWTWWDSKRDRGTQLGLLEDEGVEGW